MVVQKEFIERAHRIVWCTVATVGPDHRPRTRILHPIWEATGEAGSPATEPAGGGLVGWIVTRATPIKVRHLAFSPYLSCSYWEPGQEAGGAAFNRESPSVLRLTPYQLRLSDVETLSGRKEPLAWP